MKWFGENWGAPICKTTEHTATPIGTECAECGKDIRDGDEGLMLPFLGEAPPFEVEAQLSYHLNCFLETIGIKSTVK